MPEGSQHLDLEALTQLKAIMGNEFSMLIETFANDSVVRIECIRDAVSGGNPDEIRRAAHSFKGSASNMGAPQLTELCRTLEDKGHSGDTQGCDELVGRIEDEFRAVAEQLRKLT